MDEQDYLSVLKSLSSIKYAGYIVFQMFNEPLADRIIVARVRQAREHCPKAILTLNSNGDYAEIGLIDELAAAGLDEIHFQLYLEKDEPFDLEKVIQPKMQKFAKKLGLQWKYNAKKSTINSHAYTLVYNKLKLNCGASNFSVTGCNRGDLLTLVKPYKRTEPCPAPFFRTNITYDGTVLPCCHLRNDSEKHKPLVIGNIKENNLFELFTNERHAALRRHLYSKDKKDSVCGNCNAYLCKNVYDALPLPAALRNLARRFFA
jgi:radical SAM protein with 4Fe4S-binding SPASM domain